MKIIFYDFKTYFEPVFYEKQNSVLSNASVWLQVNKINWFAGIRKPKHFTLIGQGECVSGDAVKRYYCH